jgi:hypothetical protein
MDFYEALTGQGQNMSDPVGALGQALNAPPPTVQMPERQKPQDEMLPALTLFRLAANLAQRRQMGQSRLSQALSSVSDAGDYAMSTKKQILDEQSKRYSEDLAAAKLKSDMTGQAIQQRGAQQKNVIDQAKAPYELANLESAIKTSRSEQELKAIQLKLAKAKEIYADDIAKAERDLAVAKPGIEQQDANSRKAAAQAALNQAEAHMVSARSQADRVKLEGQVFEEGKNQGAFTENKGLPGEQSTFTYKMRDGNVITGKMPLDPAPAKKKAEQDWKAMKSMLPEGTDENKWIANRIDTYVNPPSYQQAIKLQQERIKGAVPSPTGAASAPPGAPQPGQPSTSGSAAVTNTAMEASKKDPTKGYTDDATGKHYIGGVEVSQAYAESRSKKPATAPAATTTPGATPDSSDVGAQLDAAKADLSNLSNPPPARDQAGLQAWRDKRNDVIRRIAELQQRYANMQSGTGAYFGGNR